MFRRGTYLILGLPMLLVLLVVAGCNPTPTVEGINPSSGPEKGGNQVTITGQKFKQGAQVDFGGKTVAATVSSKTSLSVTAPAGDVGTVQVTVVNPKEKRAEQSLTYTYLDTTPPTVQSVTPSDGTVYAQGTDYEDAVKTGLNRIEVTFSEPIKSADISVSYASLPDAVVTDYTGSVEGSVQVSGNTATFTAAQDFLSARKYTATIKGTDSAGNASTPQTISFSVATPERVHRYRVQEGDTLESIAARPDTYDNAEQWKKILIVNQDYNELNRRKPQPGLTLFLHW